MNAPEIELIFAPEMQGVNTLRMKMRNIMLENGYLPAWRETCIHLGVSPHFTLKVDSAIVYRGKMDEFNALSSSQLVDMLYTKRHRRFQWKKILRNQLSFFWALMIAFFPKCPFCWAAYMSLFSSLGIGKIPYRPWLLPVLIGLLFLNIFFLYKSRRRHGYKPMVVALSGALLVTFNRLFWNQPTVMLIGTLLLVTASLWNSLSERMLISLRHYFFSWKLKSPQ